MSVKVKKRTWQWGMSNLVRKNLEISPFFDGNWPRKNPSTPLNRMMVHRLLQKHWPFQSHCRDRTQKDGLCPLKKPEN